MKEMMPEIVLEIKSKKKPKTTGPLAALKVAANK